MQLHQITISKSKKKIRRGRGGKRGTYSGRGIKGQKARAGHRMKPVIRELILRIPKLRGFKNKPMGPKIIIVNIKDIEKKIKDLIITKEILVKHGLVRKTKQPVKILASGEIKRAFTFKGLKMSATAKQKIEAAGGKVEDLVEKFKPKA